MNIKEELLKLPTVEKVEITKDTLAHGVPTNTYRVFARHPLTNKLYYHMFSLTNEVTRDGSVLQLFKSHLNRWWNKLNLEDSMRGSK